MNTDDGRPVHPGDEGPTEGHAEKGSGKPGEQGRGHEQHIPPVTFLGFVLSLNASALVHLGELPAPGSDKLEKDLNLARHAIDTLAMIEKKTRGNLTPDEEALLKNMLFELRMKFVKASAC